MGYFELNRYLHEGCIDMSVLYHGSPIKIDDNYMASGTFFTIDKNIAVEYGKYIYSIRLNDELATLFRPDGLKEHMVSCHLIPIYLFNIKNMI